MPKKGYKQSEAVRKAQSERQLREDNPLRGRRLSEAHRAKIGASRKGKICGEDNPRWNGGRKVVKGYVYVLQKNHPRATKAGYILEQIVVMETYLGRYLNEEEVVHHINGDRADNCIENLQLFPTLAAHTAHHNNEEKNVGWQIYNRNHPAGTRSGGLS